MCTAVASYGDVLRVAWSVLDGLSQDEQAAVLGGNAAEIYQLDLAAQESAAGPPD